MLGQAFDVVICRAVMKGSRNWKRKNLHLKKWTKKIRHMFSLTGEQIVQSAPKKPACFEVL